MMVLVEGLLYMALATFISLQYTEHYDSSLSYLPICIAQLNMMTSILSCITTAVIPLFSINNTKRSTPCRKNRANCYDHDGVIMGSTGLSSLALSMNLHNRPRNSNFRAIYLLVATIPGIVYSLSHAFYVISSTPKQNKENPTQKTSSFWIYFTTIILTIPWIVRNLITQYNDPEPSPLLQTIILLGIFCALLVATWSWTCQVTVLSNVHAHEKQRQHFSSPRYQHLPNGNGYHVPLSQKLFRTGEWLIISSILHILALDFVVNYILTPFWKIKGHTNAYNNEVTVVLAVSHGGLLGGLLGISLASRIVSVMATRLRQARKLPGRTGLLLLQFVLICVAGFGFVEFVLRRLDAIQELALIEVHKPIQQFNKSSSPLFLSWTIQFLLKPLAQPQYLTSSMKILSWKWIFFQAGHTRFCWIIYWGFVLVTMMPFAQWLARDLMYRRKKEQRLNVAVARKYFHIVAVVLFTPVTILDPSLMVLAYSVSLALLIVLESLRVSYFSKASKDDNGQTNGVSTFDLNDFYQAFLDEKDLTAKQGGYVVTHAALITGCALPLWIHAILGNTTNSNAFIPLIGVITLGIGDACGAVFGVQFGRINWPGGSKRTLEGSLAMYLGMLVVATLLCPTQKRYELFGILLSLTLLEASTDQTDNLCLPLFGTALILATDLTQAQSCSH